MTGKYNIKLIAITAEGCMDSVVITDIFKESERDICFSNTFSPNMTGSTEGYFTCHESNNDVFYPYTSGLPVEYILHIFIRSGNVIFESNDKYRMGWLLPSGIDACPCLCMESESKIR